MPTPDAVTGWINHARLLIDAINDGRIEAKTLKDFTDEQLESFITRLQADARAEVDEGYKLHKDE